MQPKRLLLFDIDGTLMSSGGAGRLALRRACTHLWGTTNAMTGVGCAGRIDPHIFRDAILNAGISEPDEIERAMQHLIPCYLELLPTTLAEVHAVETLQGVQETLLWLQQQSSAILSLATGNFRAGAHLKLSQVGLLDFFVLGGFGEDGISRTQVLESAWRRAEEWLGTPIAREHVLVIGDTLLDVMAARQAGIPVAAVASGGHSFAELEAAQPDWLWRDMWDGLRWFQDSHFLLS